MTVIAVVFFLFTELKLHHWRSINNNYLQMNAHFNAQTIFFPFVLLTCIQMLKTKCSCNIYQISFKYTWALVEWFIKYIYCTFMDIFCETCNSICLLVFFASFGFCDFLIYCCKSLSTKTVLGLECKLLQWYKELRSKEGAT